MLAARFAASRLAVGTGGRRGVVGGGNARVWRCIRDGRTPGTGSGKGIDSIGFIRAQSGVASSTTQSSQASTAQSTSGTTSSSSSTSQAPPKRSLGLASTLALTLLTFTLGFTMAGAPALQNVKAIMQPPTDAETLTLYTPPTPELLAIEQQIFTHPLTQSLLADPDKYIASRPHLKIPESLRPQNLTGGTLLGEDKIAVPPLQFTTHDGSSFTSLQYLGPALCGHPGIVHGGLLATLLDEGLARCCFPALPNKVAVTASLNIQYKRPVMAGQVVVLRAETTKVEGRKAWVKGWLETLPTKEGEEPVVLTEGEALFIEPRQAASLKRVVA